MFGSITDVKIIDVKPHHIVLNVKCETDDGDKIDFKRFVITPSVVDHRIKSVGEAEIENSYNVLGDIWLEQDDDGNYFTIEYKPMEVTIEEIEKKFGRPIKIVAEKSDV